MKFFFVVDMEIDPGDFKRVTVKDIREETNEVKTFILAETFDYKPGQFLTVLSASGKERRSYSFSSAPGVDSYPSITVKRIPNGIVSRELIDTIKQGDELFVSEPAGFFTIPENINEYRQVFFFAAGIGITPILSLVKALLHAHPGIFIILVYSNRTIAETLFFAELQQLAQKFSGRFQIEFLFSTSPDLARARLSKSLLPVLLQEYQPTVDQRVLYYVCGPFAYMRMVLLALEEQHVPSRDVRKENFSTAVIIQKLQPPDTNKHKVILHFRDRDVSFQSQYPDTILAAAKKQGLNLPYSCENGICGSCVAKCTKGQVWHRNNEVLTEDELRNGLVLTCTAYPLYGNVELRVK